LTQANPGFSVVGLDYFLGDRLYEHTEEGFDQWAWGHAARAKALEITPRWIEEVRKQYGLCRVFSCEFDNLMVLRQVLTASIVQSVSI
jgi:hypothetical protein